MRIQEHHTGSRFLLLISFMLCFSSLFAQQGMSLANSKMTYSIINKNDTIGQMQIIKSISGDDIFFSVSSSVQTKLLMTLKVDVQEKSLFHKDKLMLSSSKRFVNDKPKGNKETKAAGDGYLLKDDNKESRLNQKTIGYNFSKLYFKEPAAIKEIYSDYYQKSLPIVFLGNHTYKIDLPESGFNVYSYADGICIKVDMHSTLFNAQMVLNRD